MANRKPAEKQRAHDGVQYSPRPAAKALQPQDADQMAAHTRTMRPPGSLRKSNHVADGAVQIQDLQPQRCKTRSRTRAYTLRNRCCTGYCTLVLQHGLCAMYLYHCLGSCENGGEHDLWFLTISTCAVHDMICVAVFFRFLCHAHAEAARSLARRELSAHAVLLKHLTRHAICARIQMVPPSCPKHICRRFRPFVEDGGT